MLPHRPLPAAADHLHYASETSWTDADLKPLHALTGLTCLNLAGNKVTAVGVRDLARALPNCHLASDHGEFPPGGGK